MFHWTDNLFFGRRADGSVRVLKFKNSPAEWPQSDFDYKTPGGFAGDAADVLLDVIIPSDEWCSIIASVSAGGEVNNRFYLAQKWHNEKEMSL